MADELEDEIDAVARGPQTDTVDGQTATTHPLPDLIEADRYLTGKRVLRTTRGNAWGAIGMAQVVKPRLP